MGLLLVARAVFIPITVAVLASYALTPIVDWLKDSVKLPKAVGAGVTLALILIGLGFGLESLQTQAVQILDIVPHATQKFSMSLRRSALGPPGAVEKIQKAASELEKAARPQRQQPALPRSRRRELTPEGRLRHRPLTSGTTL